MLAIPQLVVADALGSLRHVLTLISLITVVFTERSAANFRRHGDLLPLRVAGDELRPVPARGLPSLRLDMSASDDGLEPHTRVSFDYPDCLECWAPLYKWLPAVPHYFVLFACSSLAFGPRTMALPPP